MKKLLIFTIAAAFTASALVSCGGKASMKTDEDSLSFMIGYNLGLQMKNDQNIRVKNVISGIERGFADKDGITMEEAMTAINEYFTTKLPLKNREASEKYLADQEKKSGVQKTESGLLYEIIEAGDAEVKAVNDDDVVRVVYEGKTREGKVFDSSKERGDTLEFPLNGVIKGWTEGMKLVGKGGKIMLWIPSNLAYGEMGAGQNIGPNEALQFEVELIDVKPAAPEATEKKE